MPIANEGRAGRWRLGQKSSLPLHPSILIPFSFPSLPPSFQPFPWSLNIHLPAIRAGGPTGVLNPPRRLWFSCCPERPAQPCALLQCRPGPGAICPLLLGAFPQAALLRPYLSLSGLPHCPPHSPETFTWAALLRASVKVQTRRVVQQLQLGAFFLLCISDFLSPCCPLFGALV